MAVGSPWPARVDSPSLLWAQLPSEPRGFKIQGFKITPSVGAESSQLRVYQRLLEQGRPSRGFESAFPWLPRVIYGLGAEPEPARARGCSRWGAHPEWGSGCSWSHQPVP